MSNSKRFWITVICLAVAISVLILLSITSYNRARNQVLPSLPDSKVNLNNIHLENSDQIKVVAPTPQNPSKTTPQKPQKAKAERVEHIAEASLPSQSQSIPEATLALSRIDVMGNISPETIPYTNSNYEQLAKSQFGGSPSFPVTVATFQLVAKKLNYTIQNLSATDATGRVVPAFSGLSNGQQISVGQLVTFNLVCPRTYREKVELKYFFKIAETGESFTFKRFVLTD